MTCEALINRFLMDYCTGTLPLARRLEFDFHLTLCGDCRAYLDSYRKTINLAQESARVEEPIPQGLVDAILKTVNSGGGGPSSVSDPGDLERES